MDAFKLAVDTTNSSEGIAVVPFESNVNPASFGMQFATLPQRNAAKTYIDGISPGGGTSIGDGMSEGAAQRTGSPTSNARCRYVLLSDGAENQPAYWTDVVTTVQATGCPVMAIAFGPGANETLMQQIATDTGGSYYYNDVFLGSPRTAAGFTASDMVLDLGSTYQHAQALGERQRLLTEKGQAYRRQIYSHTVQIDASVLTADFVLNWFDPYGYASMAMALVQPNGTVISNTYDFEDQDVGHLGWRIANPEHGEWQLWVSLLKTEVQPIDYQVMVTGKTNLTAQLILPTLRRQFVTGNMIPIHALVTSGLGPVSNTLVLANVTAPNGISQTVPLQHTGGGLFRGYYTLGNQANEVNPPAEDGFPDPEPNDEGSYRVDLLVDGQDGTHRESQGAFAILEADDTNSNGLPDSWEEEHGVTDPSGNPDLDLLDNSDEYYAGTDPNNSDSDGGGEHDGSEVLLHGQDPLDPSDDQIVAPDFFQADPVTGGDVVLTYDVKSEYTKMSLYRASSPWQLIVSELPLTGLYTDTTTVLGNSYAYRLVAIDGDNHWSRVLDSENVTSTLDPVPPEASVIVNGGAVTTTNVGVTLTFAALPDEWGTEAYADIDEMKISNDPSLSGAAWQAFAQGVSWTLEANPGELAQVYVLFKDTSDNESVGPTIGSIYRHGEKVYLPLALRSAP